METQKPISAAQLEGEYRTVGMFVENAKTYIQLSTGALLLSVTFSQELTGTAGIVLNEPYLWVSWLNWLLVIFSGVTYQYSAAKYLEELEHLNGSLYYHRAEPFIVFRHWVSNPYQLYGALLFFFYFGTLWFAGAAVIKLI
jgi:hypothetical protein